MNVRPEDEIGPQLRSMGITQEDIKTLILTHFHTDHAGGLHHFPVPKY
jgi:glyoxylase-like metal-dependent hydrolase (beta-lactamase superfamily II)